MHTHTYSRDNNTQSSDSSTRKWTVIEAAGIDPKYWITGRLVKHLFFTKRIGYKHQSRWNKQKPTHEQIHTNTSTPKFVGHQHSMEGTSWKLFGEAGFMPPIGRLVGRSPSLHRTRSMWKRLSKSGTDVKSAVHTIKIEVNNICPSRYCRHHNRHNDQCA